MREGLALYKTYRHLIPTALPFWPLGMPTQQSDWVALGLRCADRTLLALWRVQGDTDTAKIPLAGTPRVIYPQNGVENPVKTDGGFNLTLPRARTAVLVEVR